MSTKPVKYHGAERADLLDVQHAAKTYPVGLRNQMLRFILGSGILDGFRCEVVNQVLPNLGHINVYNGRAVNWGGELLHDETGGASQRVTLPGKSTEYWLEVRFRYADSDPDNRAFWGALIANVGLPPGSEVNIARTFTREIPLWEIEQPIRQNAVGARTDGGYTPARFNESDELVLPIACIRTNASGEIASGNPETDPSGNDIISIPVEGGSIKIIRPLGYGEVGGVTVDAVTNVRWGRKASDQRPRFGERLDFPFLFGNSGEMIGDSDSDHWVRDWKSAYDAICTQFVRLIHGVDNGEVFEAVLSGVDPNWNWVDIKNLTIDNGTTSALNASVHPDMFMGWTFQIKTSPWAGFYAQIMHNSRKDGGDVVRLYLARTSMPPEWFPKPDVSTLPTIRLVHSREENWTAKPLPLTGNRGINSLDEEVLFSRLDAHSTVLFGSLANRLNANKESEIVLTPDTARNWGDIVIDSATLSSITSAQTLVSAFLTGTTSGKGGTVYFRKGTYTFDILEATATTVFTAAGVNSVIFKGDGPKQTILDFGGAATSLTLFELSSAEDVEFRDMTIKGKGTIFKLSGSSNIRFYNCIFESVPTGTDMTIPTVDLGAATDFLFENCLFNVSDRGVELGTSERVRFVKCTFKNNPSDATKLNYLLYFSSAIEAVHLVDCDFFGPVGIAAIWVTAGASRCNFRGVDLRNVDGPATATAVMYFTSVFRCKIVECSLGSDFITSSLPLGIRATEFKYSVLANCEIIQYDNPLSLGALERSKVHDNSLTGNGDIAGSVGVLVTSPTESTIHHNIIRKVELGAKCYKSVDLDVSNNRIQDVESGIDLGTALAERATRCIVSGNSVNGSGATLVNFGIQAESAISSVFVGNRVNDVRYGIVVQAEFSGDCLENTINGNTVSSIEVGYSLFFLQSSVVVGNHAYSVTTGGDGFRLDNPANTKPASDVTFDGNRVQAAPAAVITVFRMPTLPNSVQDAQLGNVDSDTTVADLRFSKLPRMTTAQRTGIASPEDGMIVLDTTLSQVFIYDGGWINLN